MNSPFNNILEWQYSAENNSFEHKMKHGFQTEYDFTFPSGTDTKTSDVDSLPYTSILYGSGPGYGVRPVLATEEPHTDRDRVHAAAAPKQWATHGAEDVPVYAMGELKRKK